MSYIGQGLPADVFSGYVTDTFTGDGSATTFTLSKAPFSADSLIVVVDNVIQQPTTNFTVSGTTLTIVGTAILSGIKGYAIHTGGPLPITTASKVDVNGLSDGVILDADGDTTLSSATDDTLIVKVAGSEVARFVDGEVYFGTTSDLGGKYNFAGNGWFQNTDNTDTLTLESTDADASAGPRLRFTRNSASPADGDFTGDIRFENKNDADQDFVAGQIACQTDDASDGTEDSQVYLKSMTAGTLNNRIAMYGTSTVINDDSKDIDFRVESDANANCFKVDAGSDVVLMGDGTDYASSQLQVTWADGRADSTAVDVFFNSF